MKKLSFIFIAMLVAGYSHAASTDKLYFGGGLGSNSLSGSGSAIGFQFFGGYDLPVKMGKGKLSVEAGYMDSGSMDMSVTVGIPPFVITIPGQAKVKGLWGNAVFSLPLQDKLNLIARAGLDIGDDDGFMFGAGLGFKLNSKMELRGEYVMRSNLDSLQVNFVMRM
ncbi:MAG: outer membrane beta-barrel protein [Gammaproteobacteria bacterium]